MRIREGTISDADAIRDVCLSAFDAHEKQIVAKLAVDLLSEDTTTPTIVLVAEVDGDVIGDAAFSPMSADGADGYQIYILGPLAVRPDHQKRGVGSLLVEAGKRRLSEIGVDLLIVYGDPEYYRRFGFSVTAVEGCIPPYDLTYDYGWQGVLLSDRRTPGWPSRLGCVASLRDPALW